MRSAVADDGGDDGGAVAGALVHRAERLHLGGVDLEEVAADMNGARAKPSAAGCSVWAVARLPT